MGRATLLWRNSTRPHSDESFPVAYTHAYTEIAWQAPIGGANIRPSYRHKRSHYCLRFSCPPQFCSTQYPSNCWSHEHNICWIKHRKWNCIWLNCQILFTQKQFQSNRQTVYIPTKDWHFLFHLYNTEHIRYLITTSGHVDGNTHARAHTHTHIYGFVPSVKRLCWENGRGAVL